MSIFGGLGGLGGVVGGLLDRFGGAEAIAGQVLNQMGGIDGVLAKLQQAGLGSQVQSWLGNDPNQPITADQIGKALGDGRLGQIASSLGVPPEQLQQMLAQVLPGLIDKISPHGTPQPGLMPEAAPPSAPQS